VWNMWYQKPCRYSIFIDKCQGPGQYEKLWLSVECKADQPIMLCRACPILEKLCGTYYLRQAWQQVSA